MSTAAQMIYHAASEGFTKAVTLDAVVAIADRATVEFDAAKAAIAKAEGVQ